MQKQHATKTWKLNMINPKKAEELRKLRVAKPSAEPQPTKENVKNKAVPAASLEEKVREDSPTLLDQVKEAN